MSNLHLLKHPYVRLAPVTEAELRAASADRGTALVWLMGSTLRSATAELVYGRPGGMALLIVLPPDGIVPAQAALVHTLHRARPLGILPHHPYVSAQDLAQVLRRQPTDLGAEVTEYLRWRGLGTDRETAQLVRRIIDLSLELRTISAVCRTLYVSRRTLGRKLIRQGLPVPSHWLHIGRILRVALRLQNTDLTVSSVAFDLGYPDGFSISNQMHRLVGARPSEVRCRLGWEWIFEAWLRKEAGNGGLAPNLRKINHSGVPGGRVGVRRELKH